MKSKYLGLLILLAFISLIVFVATSDLKMPGADEKVGLVVEKYAQEVGTAERDPYINTDKGDLLLFLFAVGGAMAGFWLGYNWRDLFGKEWNNEAKSAFYPGDSAKKQA